MNSIPQPQPQPRPQPSNLHIPEGKRAINYYADNGGCGHWRMIWPQNLINACQKAHVYGLCIMIGDKTFYNIVDTVKVQRQATDAQISFLKQLRKEFPNLKIIYDIDDVVFKDDIPEYNASKPMFASPKISANILEAMRLADEVCVPSLYMKEYYKDKIGRDIVTLLPNYIPKFWADRYYNRNNVMKNYRRYSSKPRIVYAGSQSHFDVARKNGSIDDFTHINDVIIKTRKQYKWVFIGGFPHQLIDYIKSGEMEYYPHISLMELPNKMSAINANLAIAPLQDNIFNRAKSNIKLLEWGAHGIPCICQNIEPYKKSNLLFNTGDELIDQIKNCLRSEGKYQNLSDSSRKYTESMFLEDHIDKHIELYFTRQDQDRPNLAKLNRK